MHRRPTLNDLAVQRARWRYLSNAWLTAAFAIVGGSLLQPIFKGDDLSFGSWLGLLIGVGFGFAGWLIAGKGEKP